ncbi:insulin-like peptide 2 isoform X3 [Anoplolepis gracilipes]|uniref:insulin-like peptide 2 isoform X3 n=1 Tax=Anoplolepis gracilipes TaxID=354296 RepID=UPI003BA374DE
MSLMSTNRLNVLVTLMIAIAFLATESGNAQADGYPQFNPKRLVGTPQKYCGKKLSNALQIICEGVYNSMFKKSAQAREEANTQSRRDINFDYVRTQEMEMADYPGYEFHPFMSRERARGMLDGPFGRRSNRNRRESRGIHEECCINACTISELSSYCAQS